MTAWLDLGLTVNRRQLRMIPSMGDALSDSFDAIVGRGALMCIEPGNMEDDFVDRLSGKSGGELSHGFNDATLTTVDPDDPTGTVDGLSKLKNSLVERQHFNGDDRMLHVIRLDVPYWSLMEEGLDSSSAKDSFDDDAPDVVELWHDCIELMVRCLSASDGDTIVIVTPHVLDSRPLPKKLLSLIRIRVAVGSILQPAALALFYDPTKWMEGESSRHITGDSIPMQTEWCGRMLSPTRIPEHSVKPIASYTVNNGSDANTSDGDHDVESKSSNGHDESDDGNENQKDSVQTNTTGTSGTTTQLPSGNDKSEDTVITATVAADSEQSSHDAEPQKKGLLSVIAGWFRG